MFRTTLLAAATLVAFGTAAAHAGSDGRHDRDSHGRGDHGGYEHNYVPGPQAGHHRHYRGPYGMKRGYPYGPGWFDYRGRSYCQVVPRKVPIKVWDRRGNSYRKWVWKDVRVCV